MKIYDMGSLLGDEDIQLKRVSGSKQDLGNGLYTLLGNDSDDQDFVYMYDTNGILRSEIPIIGYRSHRMLIQNQISIIIKLIIMMNDIVS